MLDDTMIEEALADFARSIDIPEGGADRILAIRDATSPRRRLPPDAATGRWRSWWDGARRRPFALGGACLATVVLFIGVLGALAGTGGPALHNPAGRAATGGVLQRGGATGASSGATSGLASGAATPVLASPVSGTGSAAAPGGSAPASQSSPNEVPSPAAMVIKTGSMTVLVGHGDVSPALSRLTGLAASYGGYVASTSESVPGGSQPSTGDITLRVPAASFETLVDQVRAVGTASSVSIAGQDITSQYVDLQARLQSLEDTRSQFEQILAKAQTIGDILAVEQQISDVQTQIEQLQGQLKVLGDQATYGTLAVHVAERSGHPAATAPPSRPNGFVRAWDHARSTFARGMESVVSASGGVAVFLLVVAVLAGVARLSWVAVRRRLV